MLKSIKCFSQVLLNQWFITRICAVFIGSVLFISCGSSKLDSNQTLKAIGVINPLNQNHFTGILVVDAITKDTLFEHNSDKYFTPASNVKIFTLYAALKQLREKLPALKYLYKNDTLFIEGTGDPTFLHPDFSKNANIEFLKNYENIALHLDNYSGDRYGPGWAWEDFDTYFSPETGPLPLFGNVATITQTDSLYVQPNYFNPLVFRKDSTKRRAEFKNRFYIPYTTDTLRVPFITSHTTTKALLEKELEMALTLKDMPQGNKTVLEGIDSDTMYKQMMLKSDNFLAEQMMLMVSSQLSDTLSFEIAKNQLLEHHLQNLKQMPRWVDGSGLSRYNLFTPKSFVHVLDKLYNEHPRERLFNLFPRWDENGTLSDSEIDSYIIAKSGALGNNYNLSGYLVTKSGRVLLFSIMNNHFRIPTREIRASIKRMLQQLHETH